MCPLRQTYNRRLRNLLLVSQRTPRMKMSKHESQPMDADGSCNLQSRPRTSVELYSVARFEHGNIVVLGSVTACEYAGRAPIKLLMMTRAVRGRRTQQRSCLVLQYFQSSISISHDQ